MTSKVWFYQLNVDDQSDTESETKTTVVGPVSTLSMKLMVESNMLKDLKVQLWKSTEGEFHDLSYYYPSGEYFAEVPSVVEEHLNQQEVISKAGAEAAHEARLREKYSEGYRPPTMKGPPDMVSPKSPEKKLTETWVVAPGGRYHVTRSDGQTRYEHHKPTYAK